MYVVIDENFRSCLSASPACMDLGTQYSHDLCIEVVVLFVCLFVLLLLLLFLVGGSSRIQGLRIHLSEREQIQGKGGGRGLE